MSFETIITDTRSKDRLILKVFKKRELKWQKLN